MKCKVVVEKKIGLDLAREACEFTMYEPQASKLTEKGMYKWEHSMMYTQWFWVKMYNIPHFVAMHLRTHEKNGAVHFVQTHRDDRGCTEEVTRWTPTNMAMLLNGKHLVDMARKRLCSGASCETQVVMTAIKDAILKVDQELGRRMVPDCVYRGACYQPNCCGYMPKGK